MKILLENYSSCLQQNQLYQAGFSLLIILKGESLLKSQLDSNVLIFIMSGAIKITSNTKEPAIINKYHVFFWDKKDDYNCEILLDTQIILFSFGDLLVHNLLVFSSCNSTPDEYSKNMGLKFTDLLSSFLQLLKNYMEMKSCDTSLYITKQQELFYILNSVYNQQELSALFSSLTEQSSDFKKQVLENDLNVKSVGELANLLGYGITSFRTKFKEQLGVSAYRWLLKRKAQLIIYRIIVYGDEFSQIISDFGFSSPSHFNKFCKSQFGLTPCELRKKLKTNNNF